MNDTPRMKAAQMAAMEHMTGDVYRVGCDIERELNAMTRERDIELERATHYRDRWQSAEERIKRLEDAGDAVMKSLSCGCPHGPSVFHCQTCTNSWEAWHKAKEAKP